MNIFWLDTDLVKSSQYLCDTHLRKMILEHTQLLCSTLYFTGQDRFSPYKLTHKNHHYSKWTRESFGNWITLKVYTLRMCKEYRYRFNKVHACERIVLRLPNPYLINTEITTIPQCMPSEYHNKDSVVLAYREYYRKDKSHLFHWTKRDKPEWI